MHAKQINARNLIAIPIVFEQHSVQINTLTSFGKPLSKPCIEKDFLLKVLGTRTADFMFIMMKLVFSRDGKRKRKKSIKKCKLLIYELHVFN